MKKAMLLLLLWPALTIAQPWWMKGSTVKNADFLPPDQAFRLSAHTDGNLIRVRWLIADGYYLYRSKFDISAESPGLVLDPPVFPNGVSKTDEYFGTQEIYRQEVEAVVGYRRGDGGAHPVQIKVAYQGCADAGLCYPQLVKVLIPDSTALPDAQPAPSGIQAKSPAQVPAIAIVVGLLAFFVAGLALRSRRSFVHS
jgi:thiol:disulfide interchange protein DsbD